jgi:hypothetical protein
MWATLVRDSDWIKLRWKFSHPPSPSEVPPAPASTCRAAVLPVLLPHAGRPEGRLGDPGRGRQTFQDYVEKIWQSATGYTPPVWPDPASFHADAPGLRRR